MLDKYNNGLTDPVETKLVTCFVDENWTAIGAMRQFAGSYWAPEVRFVDDIKGNFFTVVDGVNVYKIEYERGKPGEFNHWNIYRILERKE